MTRKSDTNPEPVEEAPEVQDPEAEAPSDPEAPEEAEEAAPEEGNQSAMAGRVDPENPDGSDSGTDGE